jgi:CyaY protein
MIDESRYHRLVSESFERIEDALVDVDPSDVDLDRAGDVLSLQCRDGVRCIINTQRPTRQIWVAARASAWHFSWDEAGARWVSDKNADEELFATLAAILRRHAAIEVRF